ncbi:hypothetical protein DL765_010781 [Monosporascus sp. GIB2]|nr:hypothetical protein DL765_010781 [Monosporascus sp. GIB2]
MPASRRRLSRAPSPASRTLRSSSGPLPSPPASSSASATAAASEGAHGPLRPPHPRERALPEVQLAQVRRRLRGGGGGGARHQDVGERLLGQRALQRDQAPALEDLVPDLGAVPPAQLLAQVREVLVAAGGVGDDVEEVPVVRVLGGEPRDDGVVDDAAGAGPQQRAEGAVVRLQRGDAPRRDALQEVRGSRAREPVLHHVAHVEERGVRPREVVRGAHALVGVLHRHVVAAERHHLGAVRQVQVVQRRLLQRARGYPALVVAEEDIVRAADIDVARAVMSLDCGCIGVFRAALALGSARRSFIVARWCRGCFKRLQ